MQLPEMRVVYYDIVWMQQAYFIRLYDAEYAEMGIASEDGRPKAFSRHEDAINYGTSKRLVYVSKRERKGVKP